MQLHITNSYQRAYRHLATFNYRKYVAAILVKGAQTRSFSEMRREFREMFDSRYIKRCSEAPELIKCFNNLLFYWFISTKSQPFIGALIWWLQSPTLQSLPTGSFFFKRSVVFGKEEKGRRWPTFYCHCSTAVELLLNCIVVLFIVCCYYWNLQTS